jgi:hypothetical protein
MNPQARFNSSPTVPSLSVVRPAALDSLPDSAAGSSFDPGPCVGALLANSSMAFLSLAFTATSEKRTQAPLSSSSDISNFQAFPMLGADQSAIVSAHNTIVRSV